jgi:hypothetical protein
MISAGIGIGDLTLNITEEIYVRAPLEATFAALLEQLGPYNEVPTSGPMPLRISLIESTTPLGHSSLCGRAPSSHD